MHPEKLPNGEPVNIFHPGDRIVIVNHFREGQMGWVNNIILDDHEFVFIAKVYIDGEKRPVYLNLTEIEKVKEENK